MLPFNRYGPEVLCQKTWGLHFPQRKRCSREGASVDPGAVIFCYAGAMTGSLQLRDYPGELVRLSCEKYGRSGKYRKQKFN